jgi:hypothetical protein
MGVFLQQLNKPFQTFCLWLLSCGDIGIGTKMYISEEIVRKWFKFYATLFNNEDKVIKIEKEEAIGYTTFLAFYIFYLANQKPDIKIVVIEKTKNILTLLTVFDIIVKDRFDYESVESSGVIGNKVIFKNGSSVKSFNPTTYNLRNVDELELVVFDEGEIKNSEKLSSDILTALTSEEIKKMILVITNNLDEEFPDIKTKKLTK